MGELVESVPGREGEQEREPTGGLCMGSDLLCRVAGLSLTLC
jgi:hypothetical protein